MNRWIQGSDTPGARARVVCVPRAGGTARDFDHWVPLLAPHVQVCAVQLPGRLDRFREPALSSPDEVVAKLADAVAALDDLPFVVVGDCMGSLLAFELVRELRRRGAAPPTALVVASYPPPDLPREEPNYHDAAPEVLRQRMAAVGGVPRQVLDNDELYELLLPTLRADFALFERYRHQPGPPLDVDLHATVGEDDPYVGLDLISGWARQADAVFTATAYAGGHFFLRDNNAVPAALADVALGTRGAA